MIATVAKGVGALRVTLGLSLSHATCFIFYIFDTILSLFGPNTKGRHREIVYYSSSAYWPCTRTPDLE
jgi:hypothetical protein